MPKIMGIRTSALVEIAVFFIILLPFSDGTRFADVNPHPFWIIVILIAIQYGVNEGLLAAIVASIVLLTGNIPEKPEEQYFWTYIFNLGVQPGMWLVSSLIIGLFRERQIKERDNLRKDLEKEKERSEKIATSYTKVKEIKENIERRLAGEFRSSLSIYKAAQAIETLAPEAVLNGISDLVNSIMQPEKFSIYLMNGNKLNLTTKYGWEAEDSFIENYSSDDAIYQKIVGEKKVLVINNEEDEKTLAGEGFIAGPIIHGRDGKIIGMLKIEKLGFSDLNLTSVGSFKALCSWIGMAYSNAMEHEAALEEGMVSKTDLLSEKYFTRQSEYLKALAARGNFDVTLLIVRIVNSTKLGNSLRAEAEKTLSEIVKLTLRKIDQAFQYQPSAGKYSIVLALTNEAGAKKVLEKMMDTIGERMAGNLKKVQFSFSVQALHRSEEK